MRAPLLALALTACTRVEDQVIISGPSGFVQTARDAAEACGAKTVRIERGKRSDRLVIGSDLTDRAIECMLKWDQANAVRGSAIELRGGGPI